MSNKIFRKAILTGALLSGLVLVACGPTNSTTPTPANSSNNSASASASATPSPQFSITPNPDGSFKLTANPVLFAAGSPCADVKTTTPKTDISASCQQFWSNAHTPLVPGQDIMTQATTVPHVFSVAKGVDQTAAANLALGWVRWQSLRWWELKTNQPSVLRDLDPNGLFGFTDIETAFLNGASLHDIPACTAPSALAIVPVQADTLTHLQTLGRHPSSLAVVETFTGTCSGYILVNKDGSNSTVLARTAPYSAMFTGSSVDDVPYGQVFIMDGVGYCYGTSYKDTCAQAPGAILTGS